MMILREMVCETSWDCSEFTIYDRLFAMTMLVEDTVDRLGEYMTENALDDQQQQILAAVATSAEQLKHNLERLFSAIYTADLPRSVHIAAYHMAENQLCNRNGRRARPVKNLASLSAGDGEK